MTNEEQFALCYEYASQLVGAYRATCPDSVDPQNTYVAIAAAVVSAGAGVYSANQSGKAAKQQASGEAQRMAAMRKMFGQQQPGLSQLAGIEGLAGFELPRVNPLDFEDEGFALTERAMAQMRIEGEKTFNQAVGAANLPLFNSFLTDSLERANFDFSSLPAGVTRRVEGSALARALGGPAGLAENLSVENKIRLQQGGEQGAFRALGFKAGFLPDLLNPIDSVFKLAEFELQNNQQQLGVAGLQLNALGQAANLEMGRFQLEAGYQAPNYAGVGAMAGANTLAAVGQGLSTIGMAYGMSQAGRSYGAQPGYGATSSAMPSATSNVDWRTNATSVPSSGATIYQRG
jgi:hypothetical protein